MLIVVLPDYQAVSLCAADLVARALERKPGLVLGLATGATPLGLYRELVRRHAEDGLDLSKAVTFNLDEYLGLAADHPATCRRYMIDHLFSKVNIPPQQVFMPDSRPTDDLEQYCAAFEEAIREAGGIDLQILGIGLNGHLGFNEPGSSLASRSRIVSLSRVTREANRQNFGNDEAVPEAAFTMGLGTIAEARRLLLLATGQSKAGVVAAALEGPLTASLPASLLQMHPDSVVLLDEAAAARLTRREDYDRHAAMVRRLLRRL